jgi:hypothetical protein
VWKEAENAEDFVNRITGLAAELRQLGDNISNTEIVRKMLQVVPEHLSQVAISIETLLDINTIAVEEVTGMLRAVEQRRKRAPILDNHGRQLLCEEEWMTKLKLHESEGKGGGSSSGNASGMKGGARGKGRGRGNGDGAASSSHDVGKSKFRSGPGSAKKDQCKCCGKYGHWARDCHSKPKVEAHVGKAEEDNEPVLLMARATIFPKSPSPPHTGEFQISPERQPLRIVEEKVFVQLDGGSEWDDSLWYLDSGATNHMSGCHGAFINIDTTIRSTVKFGDGLEVAIEGSSTVLFEGKTGEHLPLTGVYFIPLLTTNIISLGQLDEGCCDVHVRHDLVQIHDDRGRLIVRVQRSANRLYLLQVKIGQPLCLAARMSSDA